MNERIEEVNLDDEVLWQEVCRLRFLKDDELLGAVKRSKIVRKLVAEVFGMDLPDNLRAINPNWADSFLKKFEDKWEEMDLSDEVGDEICYLTWEVRKVMESILHATQCRGEGVSGSEVGARYSIFLTLATHDGDLIRISQGKGDSFPDNIHGGFDEMMRNFPMSPIRQMEFADPKGAHFWEAVWFADSPFICEDAQIALTSVGHENSNVYSSAAANPAVKHPTALKNLLNRKDCFTQVICTRETLPEEILNIVLNDPVLSVLWKSKNGDVEAQGELRSMVDQGLIEESDANWIVSVMKFGPNGEGQKEALGFRFKGMVNEKGFLALSGNPNITDPEVVEALIVDAEQYPDELVGWKLAHDVQVLKRFPEVVRRLANIPSLFNPLLSSDVLQICPEVLRNIMKNEDYHLRNDLADSPVLEYFPEIVEEFLEFCLKNIKELQDENGQYPAIQKEIENKFGEECDREKRMKEASESGNKDLYYEIEKERWGNSVSFGTHSEYLTTLSHLKDNPALRGLSIYNKVIGAYLQEGGKFRKFYKENREYYFSLRNNLKVGE